MSRKAGILAPISSLAGKHGIGDFGSVAYTFVDELHKTGFKTWQILPLNPVGYGNSPYQPYSSYAGDEVYISLEKLKVLGLLKQVSRFGMSEDSIDYERVREFKVRHLKEAYKCFKSHEKLQKEYQTFLSTAFWLDTYSVFITLKKENDLACWLEWPKAQKAWIKDKKYDISKYAESIAYEKFIQFIFYKQWYELKAYANKHKIEILGDIPIYVGIDSADVWENSECFLLNKDGHPRFIAGVPPDYFSETGQRWGNPIYDWDYLEKTKFKFWMDRLHWNDLMYDVIRIDHFRAFDTYWKIPASCETAIEGKWVEAPGYKLFDEIYEQMPSIHIVAEDLGDLRPEVLELRDYYKLSGMKIIQFELDPNETNNNFEESASTIVYTGTHDNQTIRGWYQSLRTTQRRKLLASYPYKGQGDMVDRILYSCFMSKADLVIIPVQDLLKLSDQARLNTPGTVGSPNWEWKLKSLTKLKKVLPLYKNILKKTKRI